MATIYHPDTPARLADLAERLDGPGAELSRRHDDRHHDRHHDREQWQARNGAPEPEDDGSDLPF